MNFYFDFDDIQHQELLVAFGDQDNFSQLVIDAKVQACLKSMLEDTAARFEPLSYDEIPIYELAEKYSTEEMVRASLEVEEYANLRALFDLAGVEQDNDVINDIARVSYYVYKAVDGQERRLVGVKKAQHFKGLASAHGRLISWVNDSLTIMEKPVFKLDRDFDLVITSTEVFAIRPNTLAFVAEVGDAATAAAGERLKGIGQVIPFLALDTLQQYVLTHKRGAHLVSSISGRDDLNKFSKEKLESACAELGIQMELVDDKLSPLAGHELALLELLDNRRYVTSLTEDAPKVFVAAARRQIRQAANGG